MALTHHTFPMDWIVPEPALGSDYLCGICMELPRAAWRCQEDHVLCAGCLFKMVTAGSDHPDPNCHTAKCPQCNAQRQFIPAGRAWRREQEGKVLQCPTNGCTESWPLPLTDDLAIEEHLGECAGATLPKELKIEVGQTAMDVPNKPELCEWDMDVTIPDPNALPGYAVKKVTYHLHHTFRTNVIERKVAPFRLGSRTGWGTFEVKMDVQLQHEGGSVTQHELSHMLDFSQPVSITEAVIDLNLAPTTATTTPPM